MFKDIYDYFVYKGVYALVISEHYDAVIELLDLFIVFSPDVVRMVECVIDYLLPVMDDNMIDNCKNFVLHCRELDYSKEEKDEIYSICNSIIGKINSRNNNPKKIMKERKKYILTEYVYREFPINHTLLKGIAVNPDDYFKMVKEFNFADFKILVFNTNITDIETYYEYLPDILENNPFFINSLLFMFRDCNVILDNKEFLHRIELSLEVVKTYLDEKTELEKKESKAINKQYKKCMNYLERKKESN